MSRYRKTKYEKYEVKPVPIYHLDAEKIILRRAIAFLLALAIIYGTFALIYYFLGR